MWGNEADVRQGAGVLWGKVLEVRLEERAVLAVEAAFVSRCVSSKKWTMLCTSLWSGAERTCL